MTTPAEQKKLSSWQTTGILLFVFFCGLPALEMNGFGFGMDISLTTALISAAAGGVIGGILICPRPWLAGLIGGLLSGTVGMLAVYYYTQNRQQVSNIELVLIQGLASLPGVGIGYLLKRVLQPGPSSDPRDQGFETPSEQKSAT